MTSAGPFYNQKSSSMAFIRKLEIALLTYDGKTKLQEVDWRSFVFLLSIFFSSCCNELEL